MANLHRIEPWESRPLGQRIRFRLEFAGLWLASRLIPLMPLAVLRALSRFVGRALFVLDRRSRAVAMENLRLVYGNEKSERELRCIARASAAHFARTMLELFWARNFTEANYRDQMIMEGWEQARALNKKHNGGIFVCLHYGNFEWLSIAGAFERLPGCIVTQQFENPLLGPVFDRLRSLSGHRIIQQQRSMLITLKHLKNGGNIGVLIDLQLHPKLPSVAVRCLDRWLPVTKLHSMLQKHTGLPIIPIESVPLPDGRYRTIAHNPIYFPPDVTEREIAQKCWDFFEPQVRRQPEAWLWAYKHWRFVPKNADIAYPSYAVQRDRFDNMLEGAVADMAPEGEDAA
ncbi:MAG: lysophospholipid acyltransferase family protein [Chthoniobacterales bacterium]